MRTVAELTLVGERRAISSDATGFAVLMYSFNQYVQYAASALGKHSVSKELSEYCCVNRRFRLN